MSCQAACHDGVVSLREASETGVRLKAGALPADAPMMMEEEVVEDKDEFRMRWEVMATTEKLEAFLAERRYKFSSLQLAKFASMMLIYHLHKTATRSAHTQAASLEGGEREEEEAAAEEVEEVEDTCAEALSHHHRHHRRDQDQHFSVEHDHGSHHRYQSVEPVDAWRKHVEKRLLFLMPCSAPFLEAER